MWKHHVNLLLQSFRSVSSDLHQCYFSTDEDPSLRIESSAIINLRGVSAKLNKYIVFTMQTYKKLIADEFVFRFDDFLSRCSAMEQTKRNLLGVSASIYDPLGLIAPITARIKTIFQNLCKDRLNWDDIIQPNIALVWNKFLEEVKGLREIRVQRCVFDLHFPLKF